MLVPIISIVPKKLINGRTDSPCRAHVPHLITSQFLDLVFLETIEWPCKCLGSDMDAVRC